MTQLLYIVLGVIAGICGGMFGVFFLLVSLQMIPKHVGMPCVIPILSA